MLKIELSVLRNGDSYISNHWWCRRGAHLANHASRGSCKGNSLREPPRTNGRRPLRTGFDHFLIGKIVSRKMSRSMSRMQIRIKTSSYRLKLGGSTLHSELSRFADFQTLRIQGGRLRSGLKSKSRNLRALGRPAGRPDTHCTLS